MGKRYKKQRAYFHQRRRPPHEYLSAHTNEVTRSEESSSSDIPGYYFDTERNRYFRIQSDGANPSTSLYTQSKVRLLEMKKESESSPPTTIEAESVVKLMASVGIGSWGKNLFQDKLKECRVTQMRLIQQQSVFEGMIDAMRLQYDSAARVFLSRIAGRSDMVGIYPENNGKISALQWFLRSRKVAQEGENCFCIDVGPDPLLFCEGQVTDMCMAPYDVENLDISAGVLWTVTGSLGRKSEAVMLRLHRSIADDPFPLSVNLPHAIRFDLGHTAVWSCAWNQPTTNMAFGVERKNIVLSSFIDNGQQVVFNKGQQSFGLCFSESGRELFSGTNTGSVVCSDFRTSVNRQCSYSFEVGKPITRLQLLSERLMLVSGYDNLLATYDLRDTRRPFLTYPNHKNDYLSFAPSVCVEDNVLCSVGSDCFVRVWNLKSGKLLSQVRPSADVSAKNVAVTYCPQSEDQIRPLLVVIAKDNFYVYQTF